MQRLGFLLLTFSLTLLLSCEKEEDIYDFQFEATVIGKGSDCGDTYLISLKNRGGSTSIIDGIYYADQLKSEFKVSGLKLYLNGRKPYDNEMHACSTLGIPYPHIVITDCIKNTAFGEQSCNYIDFKYDDDESVY
ncbi:MAG: hypothetical protein N4A74_00660 [Carboxylicivirga sp.]|jgi:hypothetical protein|nr:hypothetical protein [Carboxylicivirga sp.]